jgi:hypothetical protein
MACAVTECRPFVGFAVATVLSAMLWALAWALWCWVGA